MAQNFKVTIMGCGNMGSAIVEALISKDCYKPSDILIVEMYPNAATAKFVKLGAKLVENIDDLKGDLELLLMAVKP